MSNFSTIFDQLVGTTIPGLTGFSTKTQIPNPYALEENDINQLKNGWGIIIGDASESEFQVFKNTTVSQDIGIVLTREVRKTQNNKTPLETATKAIVEDAVSIRKDFYNADQLTIPSNIENITFTGRDAIEQLDAEQFYIITTTVNFAFQIAETI